MLLYRRGIPDSGWFRSGSNVPSCYNLAEDAEDKRKET